MLQLITKTIKLLGLFVVLYIGSFMIYDLFIAPKSTKSDNSGYSACINNISTQMKVNSYKGQYPNLSNNQIAYMICK